MPAGDWPSLPEGKSCHSGLQRLRPGRIFPPDRVTPWLTQPELFSAMRDCPGLQLEVDPAVECAQAEADTLHLQHHGVRQDLLDLDAPARGAGPQGLAIDDHAGPGRVP